MALSRQWLADQDWDQHLASSVSGLHGMNALNNVVEGGNTDTVTFCNVHIEAYPVMEFLKKYKHATLIFVKFRNHAHTMPGQYGRSAPEMTKGFDSVISASSQRILESSAIKAFMRQHLVVENKKKTVKCQSGHNGILVTKLVVVVSSIDTAKFTIFRLWEGSLAHPPRLKLRDAMNIPVKALTVNLTTGLIGDHVPLPVERVCGNASVK